MVPENQRRSLLMGETEVESEDLCMYNQKYNPRARNLGSTAVHGSPCHVPLEEQRQLWEVNDHSPPFYRRPAGGLSFVLFTGPS
jgi:hypothetical protein